MIQTIGNSEIVVGDTVVFTLKSDSSNVQTGVVTYNYKCDIIIATESGTCSFDSILRYSLIKKGCFHDIVYH